MKKLYTLLLSMLVCSMASAQGMKLTVEGTPVADKATYTQLYASEAKDKVPGLPQLGKIYGLYPEILLTSAIDQEVVVTIIDKTQDQGTQFCYGTTCDELYKMNYQSSKTAKLTANTPADLAIHVVRSAAATAPYEVELLVDAYGTKDSQRVTSTVVLRYDPDAAATVESITATAPSAYYNLSGQRVAAPTKRGIYVVNGRKVVR